MSVPLLAEVGVGANWDEAHLGCGPRPIASDEHRMMLYNFSFAS